MKIDIERLGLTEVQVDPETVFAFTDGVSGFEACNRFLEDGEPTPFSISGILRKALYLGQDGAGM